MIILCLVVQNLKYFSYFQQLLSSYIYKPYLRCSVSLEFNLILQYIDLRSLVLIRYIQHVILYIHLYHFFHHNYKNIVVSLLN